MQNPSIKDLDGLVDIAFAKYDAFKWNGELKGPNDSAFAGKTFSFSMAFPIDYPFRPPVIDMLTPIFHPFHSNPCSKQDTEALKEVLAGLWKKETKGGEELASTELIRFQITRLTGENFTVEMCARQTVFFFMESVESEHGIRLGLQRYILEGNRKQVDTNLLRAKSITLSECGIKKGSKLHLIHSGCAGGHSTKADDCTCNGCRRTRWNPGMHPRHVIDELVASLRRPNPYGDINPLAGQLLELSPVAFVDMAKQHSGLECCNQVRAAHHSLP
jgi:ubiquitin-protein ligase